MTRPNWHQPPDDLTKTAAEYWTTYAPGLIQGERLRPETAESFKVLCRLLALARLAAAEIEESGVAIGMATGGKKANPAVGILLQTSRQIGPLLTAFGLSDA